MGDFNPPLAHSGDFAATPLSPIEAKLGKGSTLFVSLPAYDEPELMIESVSKGGLVAQ